MTDRNVIPVALLLLGLAFSAPVAAEDELPSCEAVTDDEAVTLADYHLLDRGDAVEVWEETNDLEGLQTETCEHAGLTFAADEHVETLSAPDAPDVPDLERTCNELAASLPGNFQCS